MGQKKAKDLEIETLKAEVNTANKKVSLMDSLEEEVANLRGQCSKVQSCLKLWKAKMMN